MELIAAIGFLDEITAGRIRHSRRPLRTELDSIEDLASSISEKGLLQPIVVRPLSEGYEIVAGNRRFEACRRLGMRKIPSYIVDLDDKAAYEASLIENIQRKTLNPIDEAQAFKNYVDEYGYGGVSELARRIGKSEPYVSNRISLLRLAKDVKDQVIRQRITPSVAQELSCLGHESEMRLMKLIVENKIPRSKVRNIVKHAKDCEGDCGETKSRYLLEENRRRAIDRAITKYITSLKVCMMRLDEVGDSVEDEWPLSETLAHFRMSIHGQIDTLISLRKKMKRAKSPV